MPEFETTPAADTAPRPWRDSYVQSFRARPGGDPQSFDACALQQTLTEVAQRTGSTRRRAPHPVHASTGYVRSQGRQFCLTPRTSTSASPTFLSSAAQEIWPNW